MSGEGDEVLRLEGWVRFIQAKRGAAGIPDEGSATSRELQSLCFPWRVS